MERAQLEAQSRTVYGKQVSQLRAMDWIPAVVYGPDTPAQAIQIEKRALSKALEQAGSTALIDLMVDGRKPSYVVLARDIQRSPLKGWVRHVDFYQVRLTEKVKTSPRLEFVGESPLARSGRGVVVLAMNQIEVECLPTDLVDTIEVDISSLETFDDSILVGDLAVPPGVTILHDPEDMVASVLPTRVAGEEEEEEEAYVAHEEEGAGEDE
jgi:large subunit ribosomal protein L25